MWKFCNNSVFCLATAATLLLVIDTREVAARRRQTLTKEVIHRFPTPRVGNLQQSGDKLNASSPTDTVVRSQETPGTNLPKQSLHKWKIRQVARILANRKFLRKGNDYLAQLRGFLNRIPIRTKRDVVGTTSSSTTTHSELSLPKRVNSYLDTAREDQLGALGELLNHITSIAHMPSLLQDSHESDGQKDIYQSLLSQVSSATKAHMTDLFNRAKLSRQELGNIVSNPTALRTVTQAIAAKLNGTELKEKPKGRVESSDGPDSTRCEHKLVEIGRRGKGLAFQKSAGKPHQQRVSSLSEDPMGQTTIDATQSKIGCFHATLARRVHKKIKDQKADRLALRKVKDLEAIATALNHAYASAEKKGTPAVGGGATCRAMHLLTTVVYIALCQVIIRTI